MFVKRIFGTSKSPDSLICKSVYTNIPLSLFQNFITQYLFNIKKYKMPVYIKPQTTGTPSSA